MAKAAAPEACATDSGMSLAPGRRLPRRCPDATTVTGGQTIRAAETELVEFQPEALGQVL